MITVPVSIYLIKIPTIMVGGLRERNRDMVYINFLKSRKIKIP